MPPSSASSASNDVKSAEVPKVPAVPTHPEVPTVPIAIADTSGGVIETPLAGDSSGAWLGLPKLPDGVGNGSKSKAEEGALTQELDAAAAAISGGMEGDVSGDMSEQLEAKIAALQAQIADASAGLA